MDENEKPPKRRSRLSIRFQEPDPPFRVTLELPLDFKPRARSDSVYASIIRRRSMAVERISLPPSKPEFQHPKIIPLVNDTIDSETGLPIGRDVIIKCQPWRVPTAKHKAKTSTRKNQRQYINYHHTFKEHEIFCPACDLFFYDMSDYQRHVILREMKRPYTDQIKDKVVESDRKASTGSVLAELPSQKPLKNKILKLRETYCQRSEIDSSTLHRLKKGQNRLQQSRAKSPIHNVPRNQNVFTIHPKHKRKYFDTKRMTEELKGMEEKKKVAEQRDKASLVLQDRALFTNAFEKPVFQPTKSFKTRARLLMFKEVRERVTQVDTNPSAIPFKMRRSTLAGSLLISGGGINLSVSGRQSIGSTARQSIGSKTKSNGAEDRLSQLRKQYNSLYS